MVYRWLTTFIIILVLAAGCAKNSDEQLIKDLYSENPQIRLTAASRLTWRRHNQETVKKIIALLDEDNERVKFIAIQIIASLADTSAIVPLSRMLDNPNPDIRANACLSLGSIGHASALPYIVKGLKDPKPKVRHHAATALGYIHDPQAVKHLYPMFRDDVDSVRVAAIQSHYNFRNVRGAGVRAEDLTITLSDRSDRVRFVGVQALGGGFPDTTAAGKLLLEALQDKNRFVRIEAIRSLRKIHYKKAVPELKRMYNRASVDEEFEISETIKEIAHEDSLAFNEDITTDN